jgi:hypothetical protein
MQIATFIQAAKDIGPLVVPLVVLFSTLLFSNRQQELALRNQRYSPRKLVYDAFVELLLALRDKKSDDEIRSLYQKADSARRDVPFLFDDDEKLQDILGQLCNQVKHEVIDNEDDLEITKADILYDKDNLKLRRIDQHQEAKVKIWNDFRARILEQFRRFLRLIDPRLRE